jgi:hypothetical protein
VRVRLLDCTESKERLYWTLSSLSQGDDIDFPFSILLSCIDRASSVDHKNIVYMSWMYSKSRSLEPPETRPAETGVFLYVTNDDSLY